MVDFNPNSRKKKIVRALKRIFFGKFPMNLAILLVLMIFTVVIVEVFKSSSVTTGNAVLEGCPQCVCPEKQCPALDCDKCPDKIQTKSVEIIKYKCPAGGVVDSLAKCPETLPEVKSEYSGTVKGVTLAIDNVEVEMAENNTGGFVKRVDYTIMNKGDKPIVPIIEIRVYKDWTSYEAKKPAQKIINPENVLVSNDYLINKDPAHIWFNGKKMTIRLKLINQIPDPDEDIVAVTRDFDFS